MTLTCKEKTAANFAMIAVAQFAKREIASFLLERSTKEDLFNLCEYLNDTIDTVMSKEVRGKKIEEDLYGLANTFFKMSDDKFGKVKGTEWQSKEHH